MSDADEMDATSDYGSGEQQPVSDWQAGLLWRQCANLQPLLEEGKINGARRISG